MTNLEIFESLRQRYVIRFDHPKWPDEQEESAMCATSPDPEWRGAFINAKEAALIVQVLAGGVLDRARAASAADAALKDARPLPHNAYKVAIARVLVRRAVLRAGQVQDV
jgi:hypothetical protein